MAPPVRRFRGRVRVVWRWVIGAGPVGTSGCGLCCRPDRLSRIRPSRGWRASAAGVGVACASSVRRVVHLWGASGGYYKGWPVRTAVLVRMSWGLATSSLAQGAGWFVLATLRQADVLPMWSCWGQARPDKGTADMLNGAWLGSAG